MLLPTSFERGRLPPPHLRLIDHRYEKIETPVDERGVVKPFELIDLVKQTVDPSWDWREFSPPPNIHHYCWPRERYARDLFSKDSLLNDYRAISVHKGSMPRGFHIWLHMVTIPPPIPSREVMAYRIESFRVAKNLFVVAKNAVKTSELAKSRARDIRKNPSILKPEYNGIDIDGMQWVEKELQSDFSGYERHLRGLETLPPEFRLIEMDEAETNFNFVAKKLGKLVGKRAINLVPHVIAA